MIENSTELESNERQYSILTDYHLESCILDIIQKSKKHCFVVTPFFKKTEYWEHLTRILKTASEEKKRILFILGKPNEKNTDDMEKIKKELNTEYNFDLYFVENLHSKIYLNENEALITSMNLTNFSMSNNHEIGCLIKDPVTSLQIVNYIIFNQILKTGKKEYVKGTWHELLDKGQFLDDNIGHCLCCNNPIPFNEGKPLCSECRNDDKNPTKYCHKCGENKQNISTKLPLCRSCYWDVHKKNETRRGSGA
jgi:hypothetical protein